MTTGGKWEDEEERRFFEDIQDIKDFVPSSVLGVEGHPEGEESKEVERERAEREREEVRKLEEELEKLGDSDEQRADDQDTLDETPEEEE